MTQPRTPDPHAATSSGTRRPPPWAPRPWRAFTGLVGAHAAGSDEIRVGLVGCGGRGTGAAGNVMAAAPGVRIVALADAFADRLDRVSRAARQAVPRHCKCGDRPLLRRARRLSAVAEDRHRLRDPGLAAGVPPTHIAAAVAAGKNTFAEKPVAVDATQVRSCIALADEVTRKGIALGAGTQYRHFDPYIQSMKRIHDGAIGQLTGARVYYNTGELWKHDRQEGWSDLENQMRNWLYYTWLSGDHIVEQFIHNIDALNWAFNGHPLRATGTGGRQVRTAPEFGHIYDHFAIVYEDENDAFATAMCRQQNGARRRWPTSSLAPRARRTCARLQHQGRDDLEVRRWPSPTTCTCRSTPTSSRASAPASRSTSSSRWPRAALGHHGPHDGELGQDHHLGGGPELDRVADAGNVTWGPTPRRRSRRPGRSMD